ncbi:MAG: hypothetical protein ACLFS3_00845 [Candidatus Aenigmatarchaeota archaeon]
MEMTGLVFQVAGGTTISVICIVSFLAVSRIQSVVSNAEALGNEFLTFWKNYKQEELSEEEVKLASLSHTYRSLKRELEREGKVDEELLKDSLKKTREKMSRISGDEMRHLYYGAWRKFKELEEKHRRQ